MRLLMQSISSIVFLAVPTTIEHPSRSGSAFCPLSTISGYLVVQHIDLFLHQQEGNLTAEHGNVGLLGMLKRVGVGFTVSMMRKLNKYTVHGMWYSIKEEGTTHQTLAQI